MAAGSPLELWCGLLELSGDALSEGLVRSVAALVDNAAAACKHQGGSEERRIDVRVTEGTDTGLYRVKVSDDGTGVDWHRLGEALDYNHFDGGSGSPMCVGLKTVLLWSAHLDGAPELHIQSTRRYSDEIAETSLWLTPPSLTVAHEANAVAKPAGGSQFGGTVVTAWLPGPQTADEANRVLQQFVESVRARCVDSGLRVTYSLPLSEGELMVPPTPLPCILRWAGQQHAPKDEREAAGQRLLPGMVEYLEQLGRERAAAGEDGTVEGVGEGTDVIDSVTVVHATLRLVTSVAEAGSGGGDDSRSLLQVLLLNNNQTVVRPGDQLSPRCAVTAAMQKVRQWRTKERMSA